MSLLRELITVLGGNASRASTGSKVKEAETLRFPEFPTPEKYRSWRTAIREELRAASDRPDEAWDWLLKVYEEREDKRNHMAELGNRHNFCDVGYQDTCPIVQGGKGRVGQTDPYVSCFDVLKSR